MFGRKSKEQATQDYDDGAKKRFEGLVQRHLERIEHTHKALDVERKKHLEKKTDIFMYRCGENVEELLEFERERYNTHCRLIDRLTGEYALWFDDIENAARKRAREIHSQNENGYFEEGE